MNFDSAVQSQKAASSCYTNRLILPFGHTEQNSLVQIDTAYVSKNINLTYVENPLKLWVCTLSVIDRGM